MGNDLVKVKLERIGGTSEERRIEKCRIDNCTRLNLESMSLRSIPESIENLIGLEILNVSYNYLRSIPDSIGSLRNLTQLFLFHNSLASLPNNIGNLIGLEILNVSDNNLESIPDSIGFLSNLTILFLYNNKLTGLPNTIGNLLGLKELILYSNNLESLPVSIGNLTNLLQLNVFYNPITRLPKEICDLRPKCRILPDELCGPKFSNLNEAVDSLPKITLSEVDEKCADDIDPVTREKFHDNDIIVQPAPKNCVTLRSLANWIKNGHKTNPYSGVKLDPTLVDAIMYLNNNGYDFGEQIYE